MIQDYIIQQKEEVQAPSGLKLLLGSTEQREMWVNLLSFHRFPWTIEAGSVGEVEIGPVLCQVPAPILDRLMLQVYSVMRTDGIFRAVVPYHTSDQYVGNPRNQLPVTEETFGYYSRQWTTDNNQPLFVDVDFEPVAISYEWYEEWNTRSQAAREWARAHYLNTVRWMTLTMRRV